MLLSIVINVWPGTDVFRFQLQLLSLLYKTRAIDNYHHLIKEELNGWERNKFDCSDYHQMMRHYGFKRCHYNKKQVEVILAVDGSKRCSVVDIFEDWARINLSNYQIIYGNCNGLSATRNAAMQIFKGKYLIFRDDDDLSAPIRSLLQECRRLDELGVGTNDTTYQKFIPATDHVTELYSFLHSVQRKPVIAVFKNSIKLRNTRSTIHNPFAITKVPIDTTHLKLLRSPSNSSMCGRIFSREAVSLIYNSTICCGMEDARSNFLQQIPQHCIYIMDKGRLNWLRYGWEMFKKHRYTPETLKVITWLNQSIILYRRWRINDPRDYENIERMDRMFKNFYTSMYDPFFVYVLPTGSFANISWSWGTVIGVLEAFRNAHKHLDFTMNDLKHLKSVIEYGIHTEVIDEKQKLNIRWVGSNYIKEGRQLATQLEYISRHKFLFWFASVEQNYVWKILEYKMEEMKKALNKLPKQLHKNAFADTVNVKIMHPNQLITVTVNGKRMRLSNCNQEKTNKLYFGNVAYTDTPNVDWLNYVVIAAIVIALLLML